MAARKEDKNLPWGLSSDGIAPGSMKTITESKLKLFSTGMMNVQAKKTSKAKQVTEERKKRDEEQCAEVFADFVASFDDSRVKGKTFVRGSTINPETKAETLSGDSGKLYKPMAKYSATLLEEKLKAELSPKLEMKKKVKEKEKKKSNLELFKEELKRNQEERELRHKIKKGDVTDIPKAVLDALPSTFLETPKDDTYGYGSHDTGDPHTTNIYIGNISPKMNEEMLMRLFGKYGPLASVKIMWPRTDEEKSRNRNCGFVAYMRRKDGDKAIKSLTGKDIMGYEMKLGWGKAVPLPPHPIYVAPEQEEDNTPPPPSGLPFNAQTERKNDPENSENVDPNGFDKETLANAVVKVVIPKERNVISMIHRVIEFVVREGPMFEAMIMNRAMENPKMRFLFDNQSHEHVYYRWKLFSILQGDSPNKWSTEKFCMFEGGSWWKPPPCNQYNHGAMAVSSSSAAMPEAIPEEPTPKPTPPPKHSSETSSSSSGRDKERDRDRDRDREKKGSLSSRQRDKLEDMLRDLTVERTRIADSMVWCLEHADAADEISECIAESLSILETPLQAKVARLFLLSDVLHNCSVKIPNVSYFRKGFQTRLVEVFTHLNAAFRAINARMKAEQLRKQVTRCLAAWMDWAIYPPDFLAKLQNIFLGQTESITSSFKTLLGAAGHDTSLVELDGLPLNLDGAPLKPEALDGVPIKVAELDGVPLSKDNLDGVPMDARKFDDAASKGVVHIASKWDKPEWEGVDEESEKPAALPIEKTKEPSPPKYEEPTTPQADKSRPVEMDESRRKKLREIELKVAEYAQKLEAKGNKNSKGLSIAEQCNQYRAKLLEAIEPKPKKKKIRSRSVSPSEKSSRRKRRDRSASRSVSRSPSPGRASLSTSQVLQSLKGYDSRSPSPSSSTSRQRRSKSRSRSSSRGRRRSRSRSRSKSRSPSSSKRKRRSRSRSTSPKKSSRKKRSRSRSRSPSKKKSKKKKK